MNELATNQLSLVSKEFLEPSVKNPLNLRWEESSGRLFLMIENTWQVVNLKSCFPWSYSLGNYSLRSSENEEMGYVEKMVELSSESKKALANCLRESSFYFAINEILQVKDEFELRTWEVNTVQGFRRFQTQLTEWPRHLGDGFYIIQDVQNDLFVVEDISKLNDVSKKLFWPFTDN